jgi:hypothetical protein
MFKENSIETKKEVEASQAKNTDGCHRQQKLEACNRIPLPSPHKEPARHHLHFRFPTSRKVKNKFVIKKKKELGAGGLHL